MVIAQPLLFEHSPESVSDRNGLNYWSHVLVDHSSKEMPNPIIDRLAPASALDPAVGMAYPKVMFFLLGGSPRT